MNASEERAFKDVDAYLRRVDSSQTAFVLTNLNHASSRAQPDEIDQVVIGPGGALVIEVKHWDKVKLRQEWEVDPHVELITSKAKQVAKGIDPAQAEFRTRFLEAFLEHSMNPETPLQLMRSSWSAIEEEFRQRWPGSRDSLRKVPNQYRSVEIEENVCWFTSYGVSKYSPFVEDARRRLSTRVRN